MEFDTRIPLSKLEVFCAVVEHDSFTRAAERLHVAQPVVSGHVRWLEERLGAELLHRRGRGLQLTEAGEIVHAWAKDILTRSREMARQIDGLADGSSGSATIAASMTAGSYLLPAVLTRFIRRYPRADLTLTIADPEGAQAATEAGEADLGVLLVDDDAPSPHLTRRLLRLEDLVLIGPASGDVGAIKVSDLHHHPFVCSPVGRVRRRMIDRLMAQYGVEREVVISLGHADPIKHAVAEGVGLAFVFRSSVVSELAEGSLREISVIGPKLQMPLYLMHRQEKHFSSMQRRLVDAIVAELSSGPDDRAAVGGS